MLALAAAFGLLQCPRPVRVTRKHEVQIPAAVDEMAAPDQHPDTYRAWQYINIILTDSQIFVPIMDLVRHERFLQIRGVTSLSNSFVRQTPLAGCCRFDMRATCAREDSFKARCRPRIWHVHTCLPA